jgi:UDP-glucose 4-epimerase
MKGISRVLVTGGAGFIGSHLVDRLTEQDAFVRVVDNLSSGKEENIKKHLTKRSFEFLNGDLKDEVAVEKALVGIETVFHLAANPEVRVDKADPSIHFKENLLATFSLLQAMRRSNSAKLIVFFSSSTVYGEPTELPTPEDYGPLLPISVYGASKLGCEALVSSYCKTFGIRGLVFRLANIVGGRTTRGVVEDFFQKLRYNTDELEVLGDGTQTKSYLHVEDLVDAVLFALDDFLGKKNSVDIYNVGSLDKVDVKRIAEIVIEEMRLRNVKLKLTGGVDGGRGWKGDVKTMQLSIRKLTDLGWKPKLDSEKAIRKTCKEIAARYEKTKERN